MIEKFHFFLFLVRFKVFSLNKYVRFATLTLCNGPEESHKHKISIKMIPVAVLTQTNTALTLEIKNGAQLLIKQVTTNKLYICL